MSDDAWLCLSTSASDEKVLDGASVSQYKRRMIHPTLTIRIPKKLKAALVKAADADHRSLTSYVIHAVSKLMAEQKKVK